VRFATIEILRMSPAPFRKPAALENVGAADTAVAANAPSTPLRVNISLFDVVIYLVVPRAEQHGAVKIAYSPSCNMYATN
jgi:hypothetical protein